MNNRDPRHSVRIIGGNWRGRKVSFAKNEKIRPTPDRVRETLFNWLQLDIKDARCLELYSGSGILSLEALSRGAAHVVLVDSMRLATDHLKTVFTNLQVSAEHFHLHTCSAQNWLDQASDKFDIVFIDPPFGGNELDLCLHTLHNKQLLSPDCLVYIESPSPITTSDLPNNWSIHRQKKAGVVHYCLCHTSSI